MGCHLHMSSWWADSSRALLTRVHRQSYARLYPVLLVKKDGSTIHIRYREPRRMLEVSFPLWGAGPPELFMGLELWLDERGGWASHGADSVHQGQTAAAGHV